MQALLVRERLSQDSPDHTAEALVAPGSLMGAVVAVVDSQAAVEAAEVQDSLAVAAAAANTPAEAVG